MILRILLTESVPTIDTNLAWAVFETDGTVHRQGCSPLVDIPQIEPCEAIAPAAVVMLTTVKLPVRSGEKARRLLPFAVEDQLAVETDSVHFALGAPLAEGNVALAVVDKNWLKHSLAVLAAHGFLPQHLYPEMLLPAWSDETWAMVWDGQHGLVRTGQHSGMALEGDLLAPLCLSAALRHHPPKQICLYADNLPDWAANLSVPVTLNPRWQWIQTAWKDVPLDLLQGELARRQFHWKGLPALKPVLWIALAMLSLQLIGTGVEVWRLQREKQQLQASMESSFRQTFPEATVVVDPVLQMERQRATLRRAAGIADSHDFLPLLSKVMPLLPGVSTQKISYENQSIKLELRLPNTAAVDAVRAHIHNAPFKTELVVEGLIVRLKVWE